MDLPYVVIVLNHAILAIVLFVKTVKEKIMSYAKRKKPKKKKMSPNLVVAKAEKVERTKVTTALTKIIPKIGDAPVLRFSAIAWMKMMHCRDSYEEEIAAYAVSSSEDLLEVIDVWIPRQQVSIGSFEFDSESITESIERMFIEKQIEPLRCSRIWIHTHPSGVSGPSGTDEDTFNKIFGYFTWSVMVIFPKNCDKPYASLKINAMGIPSVRVKLPVVVDYTIETDSETCNPFSEFSDEVADNVEAETWITSKGDSSVFAEEYDYDGNWYGNSRANWENIFPNQSVNDATEVTEVIENDSEFDDSEIFEPWGTGICFVCEETAPLDYDHICEECFSTFTIEGS